MQKLTQDKSTRDIVPHSLTRLKDTTSKTQKASEQPRRVSTLLKGLIRRYINHKITTYYKTNYTKDIVKAQINLVLPPPQKKINDNSKL